MTAQPKAQFEELALAFNNASSPHRTPGALRVHYWLGTAGKHARADLLQLQIARLFGMYTKECTADTSSLAKALGPEKSADVEGLQELAGHARQLADAACHTAQEPFSLLQQLPSQIGSAAWLAALQDINEQAEQLELIRFGLELKGQQHWHKKPTVQDVWRLPKLAQFEQQRNHPALAKMLNELVLEAMPVLSSAVEGEANKGPCLPEPSIFMPSLAHERLQLLPQECELGTLIGDIEDVPLRWAGSALATMQQHQWDEAFLPLLPAAIQPLYEAHGSLHAQRLSLEAAGLWGWTEPIPFSWENAAEVFQAAGTGPILYAVLITRAGWFKSGCNGSRKLLGWEFYVGQAQSKLCQFVHYSPLRCHVLFACVKSLQVKRYARRHQHRPISLVM